MQGGGEGSEGGRGRGAPYIAPLYMMVEKDHACRRLKSCDGRTRCAMVGCDARCDARWYRCDAR